MITFLHGRLVEALPSLIVVEVNGVGYEVLVPLSTFDRLPSTGSEVQILTHLAVREDAHILYGFLTAAERDLFRLLINTVSGIGPRIALSILSSLSVSAFRSAVAAGDFKALSAVNGVGKKTAERIVVELKDKLISLGGSGTFPSHTLNRLSQETDTRISDAVSALMALGVKPQEATDTVRASLQMLGNDATTDQIIRASLRHNG
ncbi:MAG: Holliday junction branch migration protein RuvA [Pedosphaera sp.]|nr:Holliday junction branch migration protein RuvA [Pedosphaera sp.]